jgi:hypothetical protein
LRGSSFSRKSRPSQQIVRCVRQAAKPYQNAE